MRTSRKRLFCTLATLGLFLLISTAHLYRFVIHHNQLAVTHGGRDGTTYPRYNLQEDGEFQRKVDFNLGESDEGLNADRELELVAAGNGQGKPNDVLEGKSLFKSGTASAPIGPELDNVRYKPSTSSHHSVNARPYNAHCAIPGTDSNLPTCPFCNSAHFDAVTVYIEEFGSVNDMYQNAFIERESKVPGTCQMPGGVKCVLHHNDTMADVVFRMQWWTSDKHPVRYCYPQIVSMMNSEFEQPGYRSRPQVRHAEINIYFHISSEVSIAEGCRIDSYRKAMVAWSPPDPSEHNGVAMFLSQCEVIRWRYDFIEQLLKLVHIDMHGKCFHNVPEEPDRFQVNFEQSFMAKVRKYRAVLIFENHRQEAYISEKIFTVYSAGGVVPIYHGAPDVHKWLPGNHTYLDATKYKTPQALADYIKLLFSNDTVHEYHTTNYDTKGHQILRPLLSS